MKTKKVFLYWFDLFNIMKYTSDYCAHFDKLTADHKLYIHKSHLVGFIDKLKKKNPETKEKGLILLQTIEKYKKEGKIKIVNFYTVKEGVEYFSRKVLYFVALIGILTPFIVAAREIFPSFGKIVKHEYIAYFLGSLFFSVTILSPILDWLIGDKSPYREEPYNELDDPMLHTWVGNIFHRED